MKSLLSGIALVLLFVLCQRIVLADGDTNPQLQSLTERVNQLEANENHLMSVANSGTGGATAFLFGAVCALWAQNTNRNAWLWFFMGLFFNVVTVIVLLVKNSKDRASIVQAGN